MLFNVIGILKLNKCTSEKLHTMYTNRHGKRAWLIG